MAQILDKQGLQHYANKMCNADNRKVGSKNLPTALNEIDIAIDGFKTLFETEYGTPVNMELENNENVFSIGTGINIDKKDDVENSFTDVELNGNSLVNLVSTKGINLFGTSGSGATFDTTFNTDLTRCLYVTKEETNKYITIRTGSKERIKSNTTYTLIFNILKNKSFPIPRTHRIAKITSKVILTSLFSDHSQERFSALENPFNHIGPTWIIQASFPI